MSVVFKKDGAVTWRGEPIGSWRRVVRGTRHSDVTWKFKTGVSYLPTVEHARRRDVQVDILRYALSHERKA